MKLLIFKIFVIYVSWASSAQNCDFRILNISNTLNAKHDLIEKSEYEKITEVSEKIIELTPISEKFLIQKYPDIFKLKDSCYLFSVISNNKTTSRLTEFKPCKNNVQTKEYLDYKFKGVYCNNALIEVIGYESWGFLSVDLINGLTCYTMGKPLTANGQIAISYSNYYGEEEISMTDLNTKKQYIIGIEGWQTKESKIHGNSYYLKLESVFHTDCKKEIKYLKLELID